MYGQDYGKEFFQIDISTGLLGLINQTKKFIKGKMNKFKLKKVVWDMVKFS